jgi:hypothetical protein
MNQLGKGSQEKVHCGNQDTGRRACSNCVVGFMDELTNFTFLLQDAGRIRRQKNNLESWHRKNSTGQSSWLPRHKPPCNLTAAFWRKSYVLSCVETATAKGYGLGKGSRRWCNFLQVYNKILVKRGVWRGEGTANYVCSIEVFPCEIARSYRRALRL